MGIYMLEEKVYQYRAGKKRFFERNSVFKKFKEIDDERKENIKNSAYEWLEKHSERYNNNLELFLCLFSNLNNVHLNPRIYGNKRKGASDLFKFETNDDEIMFYMFVTDPELKLLQINSEEEDKEDIKRRYYEEFGVDLDSRLLTIELKYNERFPMPTQEDNLVLKKTKEN